jgi:hypothetical protein
MVMSSPLDTWTHGGPCYLLWEVPSHPKKGAPVVPGWIQARR